jgi:hypothetical protein
MVCDGTQWNFRKLLLAIPNDPFCGHTFNTQLITLWAILKIYEIFTHDNVREIEVYKLKFEKAVRFFTLVHIRWCA